MLRTKPRVMKTSGCLTDRSPVAILPMAAREALLVIFYLSWMRTPKSQQGLADRYLQGEYSTAVYEHDQSASSLPSVDDLRLQVRRLTRWNIERRSRRYCSPYLRCPRSTMQSFRQRRQIAACVRHRYKDDNVTSIPSSYAPPAQDNYPGVLPPVRPSLSWEEYDTHLSPKKWTFVKKLSTTLLVTAISFSVQYASAVDSMASEKIEAEFRASTVVESLATG